MKKHFEIETLRQHQTWRSLYVIRDITLIINISFKGNYEIFRYTQTNKFSRYFASNIPCYHILIKFIQAQKPDSLAITRETQLVELSRGVDMENSRRHCNVYLIPIKYLKEALICPLYIEDYMRKNVLDITGRYNYITSK